MSSGWRVIFMPLSDTISLQSSVRTGVLVKRFYPLSHGKKLVNFVKIKSDKLPSRWKTGLQFSSQPAAKFRHLIVLGSVAIKAVAAILAVKIVFPALQEENIKINNGVQSGLDIISVSDTEEMPSKKDERRMRIRNGNKGKVPWNKGRKHSPETLALIRARTKQAMQDPKVRKKLLKCAHPQSEHTKMKIGMAVRKAREEWRKKMKLQETYLLEWQDNIAEAARIGSYGEEKLQWNTYVILKENMHQEWLQALQIQKAIRKRKDSRAPKSVEQKKKISEAIRTKWEDPDYRQRVCSAMKNIYRNRPYSYVRRVARKQNVNEYRTSSSVRRVVRKKTLPEGAKSSALKAAEKHYKSSTALNASLLMFPTIFSDSMENKILDRIKQLQANRSAIEMMKREAAERARLLIVEAQKAAESLEAAAVINATAQASLFETKKLLSEAIRILQSAESASNAAGNVFQRNLGSNGDAKPLQSNYHMDNSLVIPLAKRGPFDGSDTHYLSSRNDGKQNDYDMYEYSLNRMLTGGVSHHADIYSHSTEIGRTEVLGYVNPLFGTPDNTPEDTTKIFEAITEKTAGNSTMSHPDSNFSCSSLNHASVVAESTVLDNTEEFAGRLVPNLLKYITVSVDAKLAASNSQIENIAGISETRSAHTGNSGILTSNKGVKKMWVRGRLIEAKGD